MHAQAPGPAQEDEPRTGLPYQVSDEIKILGVLIDRNFRFEEHIAGIRDRAKMRMVISSRLAGCTWGAEVGLLMHTGDAPVTSLLRYGLLVVGSGAYKQALRALEVGVTSVLARKILGVGRTARIVALHAAVRVFSVHNLCIQQCASLLVLSLRTTGSSITTRIRRWLMGANGVREEGHYTNEFDPPEGTLPPRIWPVRFYDFDMQETWFVNVLSARPTLKNRNKIDSAN